MKEVVDHDRLMRRILRDEQAVTADLAGEVVAQLHSLLAALAKSVEWAAAAMGMEAAELERAIGAYAAEHEPTIRVIDKWCDVMRQQAAAAKGGTIKTGVAEKIFTACRFAATQREFVLITGPSGCGKTTSARAAAAETPGSIYISISTAGATTIGILKPIAEALRLKPSKSWKLNQTAGCIFEECVAALKGTGRLLIVDEAQKMACRRKDQPLHVLRDLYDQAGIGLVLLAVPSLARYLEAGHSRGEDTIDQVRNRIALFLDVTEEAEQVGGGPGGGSLATVEDIRRMVAGRKLRLTTDAIQFLAMLANTDGSGGFRDVAKLLAFAERFARGGEVTAEMLRGIQARRLGVRTSAALENRMGLELKKVSA